MYTQSFMQTGRLFIMPVIFHWVDNKDVYSNHKSSEIVLNSVEK